MIDSSILIILIINNKKKSFYQVDRREKTFYLNI